MRCIVFVAFCLFVSAPVRATTLVALWTPEKVILAADSRVVQEGSAPADACKIARAGETWIAVSGLVSDAATGFDLGPLARPALAHGRSLKEQIALLADAIEPGLSRAVHGIRRDAPSRLATGRPVLQAILAGQENGKPVLATIGFIIDATGALQSRASLIDGSDARGPRLIYAGQQDHIRAYLRTHPDWIDGDAQALVRDLVQLEIDAASEYVGGPVDLLRIDAAGSQWVQKKPTCVD